MKEVICKIDVVGLTGGQFYKHEIYEVNHEFENGIYMIDNELVQSKYFDDLRVGVVAHKGVNGKAVKGLKIGKEYPAIGILGEVTDIKAYYICYNDNEDVRCVSSKVFELPEWFLESDVDSPFLGFTTDELIEEIERRNSVNPKIKKLVEIYGISSEAELEEIRLAAKAIYEYYFGKESNCFDASTADLTEGDGLHWGLLAIQVMEKSIEKNMDYETVLKEYLLNADPENKKLSWTDGLVAVSEE